MNKKLIITGNGFDLAHGLKTSYGNFSATLSKEMQTRWESLLKEFQVQTSDWYSFEEAIDKLTAKWQEQYFFSVVNDNDSKESEQLLLNKVNQINQIFSELTVHLFDYISKENQRNIELKTSIIDEVSINSYAISFNYTNLINHYTDKVYYIHGSIDEENIVLGYKLRAEQTGIMHEATKYDKNKLREALNFRRYLLKNNISQKTILSELVDFEKHVDRMFSGRGGYVFDYTKQTDQKIMEFNNANYEFNSYSPTPFNYLKDNSLPQKFPSDLESITKKERLQQISELINNYGEQNNFSPAYIETKIPYNEIEELIILGHSLSADIEIFTALFELLVNLREITLFIYEGENFSEKLNILESLSSCPIKTKMYD